MEIHIFTDLCSYFDKEEGGSWKEKMFVPQRLNHSQLCNIVYRSGYNHNVLSDLEQNAKFPSTVNSTKTSNVQLNIPTQIPSVPDKNVAYMNRTCCKVGATAVNKHWGDIHQEQGDKDYHHL
jgi:hypothetical protein